MKLIVGLGNPGPQYAKTRHNAGFMVLDWLVRRNGLGPQKARFHADAFEGRIGDHKVLALKPMTFMNRSGLAVGEAMRFYKAAPEDVLVVVDDTAIPCGSLRLRPEGSAGGHNGLADIQRELGTNAYPRLRVGVDEPVINERRITLSDYVLGNFSPEQME
ncbi:MAG: aminoacyl-tRNA hydrolase, partial [Planctomycetota bacterium]